VLAHQQQSPRSVSVRAQVRWVELQESVLDGGRFLERPSCLIPRARASLNVLAYRITASRPNNQGEDMRQSAGSSVDVGKRCSFVGRDVPRAR
jgi:hypothetical protein